MHLSDIKKFTNCPRLYQYSLQDKSENFSFYNVCINTDESIAKKLHLEKYTTGVPNSNTEDTLLLAKDYQYIFKARFVYGPLRVKVPLIHIVENHCDLYFTSLSLSVDADSLVNFNWTKQVVEKNGLTVDNIYVLHLNKAYTRDQQLDDDSLWVLTDKLTKKPVNLLEGCNQLELNMDAVIESLLHYDEEFEVTRSYKCSSNHRCKYYDKCYPDEVNYPDNSITTLVASQHKYEMLKDGILYLKDADSERIEGNQVQYAQIMADKAGGIYLNKMFLKKWLDVNIKFPISFVDFEWDLYPIPPYQSMSVMQVLPFQYSLHVYDGQQLQHYQYIGEKDCRLELVESLISQMPKTGSILAYNAVGAEKIRIKEFANLFPQYHDQLMDIYDRMVDMAYPFTNGLIYDTRMRGNFSLKVIENIIDKNHSYHDLEVGNGLEAVEIYRSLVYIEDTEEKKKIYDKLFSYCGLDTYSLYKVYLWLKGLLSE